MRPVWTAAQARAADATARERLSEATLIERAAQAVATRALAMLPSGYGSRAVVVAGKGHNGADALSAGVLLAARGVRVDVVLAMGEPADEHGQRPLATLRRQGAHVVAPDDATALLARADLVIDGVLGVGGRPDLPWPRMGAALADARAPVLAVDLPTGVDADTGAVSPGAVSAAVTVTFGALKVGLAVDPGAMCAGVIDVAGIGLASPDQPTAVVIDADDVATTLAVLPRGETTKYERGVVGIVAGGPAYVGAAVLCAAGALRAGAGMVRLHAAPATIDAVRGAWPEVVGVPLSADGIRADAKTDAWVVGPGLGTDDDAAAALGAVLATNAPVVVDADAITLAAREPELLRRAAPTLVTPHVGEFQRLTGMDAARITADRLGVTRAAAANLDVIVLLKGRHTIVASPTGMARINPTGTPALATAGTGDILAGACGAYAAGIDLAESAAAAAWLHGLAARIAAGDTDPPVPIVAMDVAAAWPAAVRRTLPSRR
ncbi:MAG: NAD(P)H-hydrate dehydratase [Mycobacteriales bacterium]